MVERRCRTTLLAQTEGVAEPLLSRNEVNPRTELAQASWALPGKDYAQSIETVFEPASFEYVLLSYSSSGLPHTQSSILYRWMARETDAEFVYYVRSRYYQTDKGIFLTRDTRTNRPDDEQWLKRDDAREHRYNRMVYGDIVDEWNEYAVENVFWQVRSFIRPIHAYTWIWQRIVPDPTSHFPWNACLLGALSSGAICLTQNFFIWEKTNIKCMRRSGMWCICSIRMFKWYDPIWKNNNLWERGFRKGNFFIYLCC